ncbi:MAG: hypothetical protein ACOCT0_05630 [Halobacteriota archaeon]
MESKGWNNGLESEPVTTYVSEDTKEAWKEHADALDMSLSRFVETMVNAGRSLYGDAVGTKGEDGQADAGAEDSTVSGRGDEGEEPTGYSGLEAKVTETLGTEPVSVEDVAREAELDETTAYEVLQSLVASDAVSYDPLRDVYRTTASREGRRETPSAGGGSRA